ncbi:sigma-70 family RNA polymerase sigma factor [bacterium]|nr:MAG: sigma-70 family RNA polymerase sigma factor [bacterium]
MDDLEFARRCVEGDKRSWDEFVDRYSRLIYNYIHSTLKIKGYSFPLENIRDLFQDIFLLLTKENFKKLRSFKGLNKCSLASWLRQVTVNFTLDSIRRIKPLVSINEEDENGFSLEDTLSDSSEPLLDRLGREEKLRQLKDCIERLETDDKYFLELHLERGLSLEELRGHLRLSRGAIDMRKARIIKKLKKCFKSKGFALDL